MRTKKKPKTSFEIYRESERVLENYDAAKARVRQLERQIEINRVSLPEEILNCLRNALDAAEERRCAAETKILKHIQRSLKAQQEARKEWKKRCRRN